MRTRFVNLRRLILALTLGTALAIVAGSLLAIYEVQRQELIKNTLGANRVYAAKLAEITESFLKSAQDQVAFSATRVPAILHQEKTLQHEVERLHKQTNAFNSVAVVNAAGIIIATSPTNLGVRGKQISGPGSRQSIEARRPLITDPFISPTGRYLISISHPLFDDAGHYKGYISGAIYLHDENTLYDVLGQHNHQDGSYIYVVDRHKTLIYHPETKRIGETINGNEVVDRVTAGQNGAMEVINSRNIAMLAGFAPVTRSGWGVVAQRPITSTLSTLDSLRGDIFARIAPLVIGIMLLIWIAAWWISRPLRELADIAGDLNAPGAPQALHGVGSWYFEAEQLKGALQIGVGRIQAQMDQLRTDSHTDPLTSLLNRRGLTKALKTLEQNGGGVAVLALDIDHFKRVNDSFGHAVGDLVIQQLADLLRANARKHDLLCRNGGEEFLVLLPDTGLEQAILIAERLRHDVEHHTFPGVGTVTISIGVARQPDHGRTLELTLHAADEALYQAKHRGRNQAVQAG